MPATDNVGDIADEEENGSAEDHMDEKKDEKKEKKKEKKKEEKKEEKKKEKKKEKTPHMCESIGHWPLRGRCPKAKSSKTPIN